LPKGICGFHTANLTLFQKFMHRHFGLTPKSLILKKSCQIKYGEIKFADSYANLSVHNAFI